MKEFIGYNAEARKSFQAEGATIKQVIQSAKSHESIATTKASLEWGNTYSLFFDLAKCNLWEYYMEDADTLKSLEDKQIVFSQSIGLAGALAYLHHDLYLASSNEQLQCYHLDLKPQNILVFETSGKQIWKISDFGMSQIKHIPGNRSGSEAHVSFLDKIFSRRSLTTILVLEWTTLVTGGRMPLRRLRKSLAMSPGRLMCGLWHASSH